MKLQKLLLLKSGSIFRVSCDGGQGITGSGYWQVLVVSVGSWLGSKEYVVGETARQVLGVDNKSPLVMRGLVGTGGIRSRSTTTI